jgi:hypothetical protein
MKYFILIFSSFFSLFQITQTFADLPKPSFEAYKKEGKLNIKLDLNGPVEKMDVFINEVELNPANNKITRVKRFMKDIIHYPEKNQILEYPVENKKIYEVSVKTRNQEETALSDRSLLIIESSTFPKN